MNPSGLRPFHWLSLVFVSLVVALSTGCRMNDPNYNGKLRYSMATIHASSFLKNQGAIVKFR